LKTGGSFGRHAGRPDDAALLWNPSNRAQHELRTVASNCTIRRNTPDNAIVSLRGLTIDLRGTANNGIHFLNGSALRVYDTHIRKAGGDGIHFAPISGQSELFVADTVIADTLNGIQVRPTTGAGALVTFDHVRVDHAAEVGILFQSEATGGGVNGIVRDSIAADSNMGIKLSEGSGGLTRVMIDRTAMVNNAFGLYVFGAGATARIGDSVVSANGTGLSTVTSGVIESYQTNKIDGNGTDGAATNIIAMK